MLGIIRSVQIFFTNIRNKNNFRSWNTLLLIERDGILPLGESLALILQKNYCDLRHEGQKWMERWQQVKLRVKSEDGGNSENSENSENYEDKLPHKRTHLRAMRPQRRSREKDKAYHQKGWVLSISNSTGSNLADLGQAFEGQVINVQDLYEQLSEERKDLNLCASTDVRNLLLVKVLKHLQKKV